MRIRNLTDTGYHETLWGVPFVNGESQGHLNQGQIDRLKAFGTFQFEEIPEPCPNCLVLEKRIIELEDKLSKKKIKNE